MTDDESRYRELRAAVELYASEGDPPPDHVTDELAKLERCILRAELRERVHAIIAKGGDDAADRILEIPEIDEALRIRDASITALFTDTGLTPKP